MFRVGSFGSSGGVGPMGRFDIARRNDFWGMIRWVRAARTHRDGPRGDDERRERHPPRHHAPVDGGELLEPPLRALVLAPLVISSKLDDGREVALGLGEEVPVESGVVGYAALVHVERLGLARALAVVVGPLARFGRDDGVGRLRGRRRGRCPRAHARHSRKGRLLRDHGFGTRIG